MRLLYGFVVALGLALGPPAQAQNYPDRPVKLLVPLAAASAVDIVARLVGERIGDILGQRFYVENQPGAAGLLGMPSLSALPFCNSPRETAASAIVAAHRRLITFESTATL